MAAARFAQVGSTEELGSFEDLQFSQPLTGENEVSAPRSVPPASLKPSSNLSCFIAMLHQSLPLLRVTNDHG